MSTATRFFLQPDLAKRYNFHKRAILRWRKAGRFPEPDLTLPNGWPAWKDTTIEAYERNSMKRRVAAAAIENAANEPVA